MNRGSLEQRDNLVLQSTYSNSEAPHLNLELIETWSIDPSVQYQAHKADSTIWQASRNHHKQLTPKKPTQQAYETVFENTTEKKQKKTFSYLR